MGLWYRREEDPESKGMKRTGNIYERICSVENLLMADEIARKGKLNQPSVQAHDRNREANIQALHEDLTNKRFKTSPYTVFTIHEPKERVIYRLPYYPDRIVHHAIMNVLEPVFVSIFTADTYSCIKGRGIHAAYTAVKKALKNKQATTYCLKLDIKKFYPSIDHEILKKLLRKKFKDADLLSILDETIDSADGLPIGNYLSQYLANFYLSYFDHWIKERLKVKHYFRYADDIVMLADNKPYLHRLLAEIKWYLQQELKLTVKDNYQVFPVSARGIDFVGYRFFHTHTLVRKGIKKNGARMMKRKPNDASIAAYLGWFKWANARNLEKTLFKGHAKLQRIRNTRRKSRTNRRQNKNGAPVRQRNSNSQLQGGTI